MSDLSRLSDAATPGPWTIRADSDDDGFTTTYVTSPHGLQATVDVGVEADGEQGRIHAEFIAAAVNHVRIGGLFFVETDAEQLAEVLA